MGPARLRWDPRVCGGAGEMLSSGFGCRGWESSSPLPSPTTVIVIPVLILKNIFYPVSISSQIYIYFLKKDYKLSLSIRKLSSQIIQLKIISYEDFNSRP